MNAFRNPFLLVVLFCSLFLVKCTCDDGEDDPTIIEQISKAWRISELTVDGAPITAGIDGFTLTLNESDGEPTTYSISTGGLAYNFAPNTSGDWSVNNNDNPTQITFSGSTVSLINAEENQLVIQYNEPASGPDKPEPVVRFVLEPR